MGTISLLLWMLDSCNTSSCAVYVCHVWVHFSILNKEVMLIQLMKKTNLPKSSIQELHLLESSSPLPGRHGKHHDVKLYVFCCFPWSLLCVEWLQRRRMLPQKSVKPHKKIHNQELAEAVSQISKGGFLLPKKATCSQLLRNVYITNVGNLRCLFHCQQGFSSLPSGPLSFDKASCSWWLVEWSKLDHFLASWTLQKTTQYLGRREIIHSKVPNGTGYYDRSLVANSTEIREPFTTTRDAIHQQNYHLMS